MENALYIAQSSSNTTVEPEHLLKAILAEKSVLNMYLPSDEVNELTSRLATIIEGFGKVAAGQQQPQLSAALNMLLINATKKTNDYISIPLLLQQLLENSRIAKLFKKPEELKKRLAESLQQNKPTSANSDDPEDKMSKFAVEMVEQARQNKFDPVIGRDEEIRQVIEILSKKTKSNAIMVGKPGVGKTAIVNGIAQLIARGETQVLEGYKLYNVDVGSMVAGACHRGDFEERLKGLVKEAEENRKVILFIDEIHIVLGAGKTDGSLDAANILKPGLADGTLKVIGATTYDEYRKYVSKDPAFERRFTRVNVREPSIEDTITIMRGLRERIETHHGVKIADRALVYASTMGKRYITNRRLPDLAIDLVDTACASAIISLNSEPQEIAALRSKVWSLDLEKTSIEVDLKRDPTVRASLDAVEKKLEHERAQLKALEDAYNAEKGHLTEARELKRKLEDARNRMEQAKRENNKYLVYDLQTNIIPVYEKKLSEFSDKVEVIDAQHIAEVISRLSGVPASRLTVRENERLLGMADKIKEDIFGQDGAVDAVVGAIVASRMGLSDENKPIGSFMFLGPTGVGKTELSKAICRELNGTCDHMVVLDMSDYSSEISINKLLGAPAGYVGCEEGGSLTEPIKEMPYNVVLLDEFDLAHQSVLNVLYQLLDEGRVTDGRGVRVSFRNTVVIMTSNLGQEYITRDSVDRAKIEELVLARFGHPLINRIDSIVTFDHLSTEALAQIFNKELSVVNRRLADKNMSLRVSDAVLQYAVSQAYDSNYGARIMKRFVKDNFITAMTKILLMRRGDEPLALKCFLNSEGADGFVYGNYTYATVNE